MLIVFSLMYYLHEPCEYDVYVRVCFQRRLAHAAKKAVSKMPVRTVKHGGKVCHRYIYLCYIGIPHGSFSMGSN